MNILKQVEAVSREVADKDYAGKPARAVVLSQTYATNQADLWDAVTNSERLPRWFAPVHGDLVLNGRFQVEGNAAGTITRCDAPNAYDATWEFGGGTSWIEVRVLRVDDDHSLLELTHVAHPGEHWDQFGPGAVGIGWDLSFLGLALHLESGSDIPAELTEWGESAEAIEFMTATGKSWITADIAGGSDEADATRRGNATIDFYTGADVPGENEPEQ